MVYLADAIANEFLSLEADGVSNISPMKLQKLVYYAHGWCLGLYEEPLIDEAVQAWKFGPVIYSLYREFKEFGNQSITRLARELRKAEHGEYEMMAPRCRDFQDDTTLAESLVKRIWNVYGKYSAVQLSKMTHAPGTPWHRIAARFNGDVPPGLNIPNEMMQEHFASMLLQRS